MKVLNFLTAVGNQFLYAWVAFKVYGWFSPEVGFELPNLSYMNILVISWLISFFTNNALLSLYIGEIHSSVKTKEDDDISSSFKLTILYLVIWLYFYILYSIFF